MTGESNFFRTPESILIEDEKKDPFRLLEIEPHFVYPTYSNAVASHVASIKEMLKQILPERLQEAEPVEIAAWLKEHLPIVQWTEKVHPPDVMSIFLLCAPQQQMRLEGIFLDLLKKWLILEKEIQVLSLHNMYFYLRHVNAPLLFMAKADILVEDGRDFVSIQNHLPILAKELALSASSRRYAAYVLDTKALSYDEQSTLVHQELRQVLRKYPESFDAEIYAEMSRFFALANPSFRTFRPPRQMTRLILSHYLMRRHIMRALSLFPEKRHLSFRLLHTHLHFPFGSKPVLGVAIVLGQLDKYESFEESHILLAVQKFVPEAQVVKGSFYVLRQPQDPICCVYLEFEKRDGTPFEQEETDRLKSDLEDELKKRIEKLIPSVFMIRNEEEVMRNILLLSQELKLISDLPQVMISFDKQTASELIFTVILVRVLKPDDVSLKTAFGNLLQPYQFMSDRVQIVGYLRKKNPKEANVFHLSIPKELSVLRADSSVNFYLARQKVVSLLTQIIGEIRDYNGGMILKQGELFSQFKHAFREIAEKNQDLMENFFFSLSPVEAQATLPSTSIEALFELFVEACSIHLNKKDSHFIRIKKRKQWLFAVVRGRDIEDFLTRELMQLENFSKALIKTQVSFQGSTILGYIYEVENPKRQRQFSVALETAIAKWIEKIRNQQELRLSFIDLPTSLDPRIGGDELASTVLKMLFDGLMRIGHDNKPTLAIASSVDISPDQKTYTFKLRPCLWSNDTPVVAYDFEYAWKKILTPSFYTPFAYFFFPIKNAKLAKEGKSALDQVGVKALDEKTLVVELEHPTPEFLELTAYALYSPVNHQIDRLHPNWSQAFDENYVCNGPFKLHRAQLGGGFEFVKNPTYWDREVVKIDRIQITKDNSVIANEQYKQDETDWLGRPLRPWEPYFAQGSEEMVFGTPLGTYWLVFNVERFPFHHKKLRQAIAYAINREELVKTLPFGGLPASTPLPLAHTHNYDPNNLIGDPVLAKQLFEEALSELGLSRRDFPVITIIHTVGKTREAVTKWIRHRLHTVLGLLCRTEELEFHVLFSKMTRSEYQMGFMSWKSWINDPIYTLNAFKYRSNKVNFAKWEDPEFQKLLDQAQNEIHLEKRLKYLQEAEKILITELPVVPILYEVHQYTHKKHLKGALHSDAGNLDLKWAYISR